MSVLYLALPHISATLGSNAAQELWILDIYPLLIAGFLVLIGALGDRIGQRRLLLGGAAAFAVVSTVAAFPVNAEMLIAARAALGAAGATLMPSTLGLLNVMFTDPHRRRTVIAIWSSAFMTGFAAGPLLGGALLDVFWWGSVFLLAVPVMVLLMATGPVLLPEHRRAQPGRFDLSSALFFASLLPLVYRLKNLAHDSASWASLALIGAGLLALAAFAVRQYRLEDPLLDLRLLTDRTMATALLLLLLGPAIIGGLTVFVPQYLQLTQGLTALQAGALVAPAALGLIVGALLAPAAARRFAAGTGIATGLVASCVGLLMVAFEATAGPAWVVAGLIVVYPGSGPFDALGTDLVGPRTTRPDRPVRRARPRPNSAQGWASPYSARLEPPSTKARSPAHCLPTCPTRLPPQQASRSRAPRPASALDEEQALAVREAAGAAFASGMQAVSIAGAAIAAVLAIMAVRLLRHA